MHHLPAPGRPRRRPPAAPSPPLRHSLAAEVQEVVDEGRRRFVASFPSRFEVLTVMIESAGTGDADALLGLQHSAHRLVGRAGATRFLRVAPHAAALESLATLAGTVSTAPRRAGLLATSGSPSPRNGRGRHEGRPRPRVRSRARQRCCSPTTTRISTT